MTNKMFVGSQDEAEECEYVVCVPATDPLHFPDNVVATCCQCSVAIQHRPHIPKTPKLICLECVLPEYQEAKERGEDIGILVTPQTRDEVMAHLSKKLN